MKTIQRALLTAGLAASLASLAPAAPTAGGGVGDVPENTEQIEDFAQTGAESFADFQGRAILVEFFAYW